MQRIVESPVLFQNQNQILSAHCDQIGQQSCTPTRLAASGQVTAENVAGKKSYRLSASSDTACDSIIVSMGIISGSILSYLSVDANGIQRYLEPASVEADVRVRQGRRTKPLAGLVRHDDATHADPIDIGPLLLDPAHVTGDLADEFIVPLVPLEFDHDIISDRTIPGKDVEPFVLAALHSCTRRASWTGNTALAPCPHWRCSQTVS